MAPMTKNSNSGLLAESDLSHDTACWSACQCGSYRQPMAAEAATAEGAEPARKLRKLNLAIAIPLVGVLLPVFCLLAWFIEFMPRGDTARVLGLVICLPLALIGAVALAMRLSH